MGKKAELVFWAATGATAAGIMWYRNGMRVPWSVYKQFGYRERRRLENHQAQFLLALNKYEDANPGSISDEVFIDAEDEFTDTMIDNDVMGVWNKIFKRRHPFFPRWETVLDSEEMEDEDDE